MMLVRQDRDLLHSIICQELVDTGQELRVQCKPRPQFVLVHHAIVFVRELFWAQNAIIQHLLCQMTQFVLLEEGYDCVFSTVDFF